MYPSRAEPPARFWLFAAAGGAVRFCVRAGSGAGASAGCAPLRVLGAHLRRHRCFGWRARARRRRGGSAFGRWRGRGRRRGGRFGGGRDGRRFGRGGRFGRSRAGRGRRGGFGRGRLRGRRFAGAATAGANASAPRAASSRPITGRMSGRAGHRVSSRVVVVETSRRSVAEQVVEQHAARAGAFGRGRVVGGAAARATHRLGGGRGPAFGAQRPRARQRLPRASAPSPDTLRSPAAGVAPFRTASVRSITRLVEAADGARGGGGAGGARSWTKLALQPPWGTAL